MLWMLHNVTALESVKITRKIRSLTRLIPFQDNLLLCTKYFMLNEGVYSAHTTVKSAQVKLAHSYLSLQPYIFTNIIERFISRF